MTRLLALAAALLACRTPAPDGPDVGDPTPPADAGADTAPAVAEVPPAPRPEGRLGDDVVPVEYRLELVADRTEESYTGRVAIDLDIREPVSQVWLHGRDLDLGAAALVVGEERARVAPVVEPGGLVRVPLGRTLAPGRATLELDFAGRYGSRTGIFRQSFDNQIYLLTDFEPTDARGAVPCFDDPKFHAVWRVTLEVAAEDVALANMPVARETAVGKTRKRVEFEPTPPLPSYLVAFAAGPFELVEAEDDAVPIRIVVPEGRAAWAAPAAEMAPALLDTIAAWVGRPVPFPKLDFITVPSMNGAMENPGLITVASHILLTDPDALRASAARPSEPWIAQQRLLALVLAHEIAHLWFGDWATMDYWTELWLNEGFATWLADKALAAWRPQRNTRVDEVTAKYDAMAEDTVPDARAVRQPVTTRKEIAGAFDALTYKKGGAVLAMLEGWLGAEPFQRGIRAYLDASDGGTVTTDDLIAALAAERGPEVGRVMRSFLDQPGVPLVTATPRCEGGRAEVELTQEPYTALGGDAPAARSWSIPVCVRYPDGAGTETRCALVEDATVALALDTGGGACPAWIYPNAGARGYFRFDVPDASFLALARAPLGERERAELFADVYHLLLSGDVDVATAIALVRRAPAPTTRHDLRARLDLLTLVADHLLDDRQRRRLGAWVRKTYGARARALGVVPARGEDEEATLTRPTLVRFVARYGRDRALRRAAIARARAWLAADDDPLTGAGAATVLEVAAGAADAALLTAMIEAYQEAIEEDDYARADALASGLGGVHEDIAVDLVLELIAGGDVALPHARDILASMSVHPDVRRRVLDFAVAHQAELSGRASSLLIAPLFGSPTLCDPGERATIDTLARAAVGDELAAQIMELVDGYLAACAGMAKANQAAAKTLFP